ncbi:MAG: DNA-binding protein HU-alpha [Rhodobacteraceae bacterium HLUCCA08]|nr:MAG: DNA-binding protein HU-alpha [Rhodobacteraceae bacterium HLUCCA08]
MAARTSKSSPTKKTTTPKTAPKAATPKAATPKVAVPKVTAAPKAATTPPGAAPAPVPTVVDGPVPVVAGPVLKKPELVDRIVAESGLKKKDVKPVLEAMLTVLGKALANGEELNLPPLGKVKVNNQKDMAKARVLNLRLRQPKSDDAGKDPLAEAAE